MASTSSSTSSRLRRRRSRSSVPTLQRGRRSAGRGRDHVCTAAQAESSAGTPPARPGRVLDVERIITLPRLEGPSLAGLPSAPEGFLVTDAHARVQGVPDVYAAGDVTDFAIKQGGIACQQADAAADDIAASRGRPGRARRRSQPVLRGMLLTERWARFLRPAASRPVADRAAYAGRRPRSPAASWPATSRPSSPPTPKRRPTEPTIALSARRAGTHHRDSLQRARHE